ncbi:zinc ABC transporter ATP-binding protein AztA [Microtetraspora sp. NBRC 16547]|uniref:zinc ABC transporter ATP-binding protein AztA n=1 Tax=Microtetraspora sp. NBRC 16547 TaxID=3030993 RepID=UPI00249FB647|nr:zinc ABC transporter ATP-binding protein AztA [Microtetraspora sp. NBRC 16547]GLW98443.1 ABC transporter ATP-binding protein [Microtetraspora sp. NBRC 16547]
MVRNDEDAAVAIHGVSAGYSRRTALREITARIPRCRVTAVVGPNGSGKSTLLGVLAGVIRPVSGSVERASTRRPGFVVQRSAVSDSLPITVREAVAMGRWAHRGPWRRLSARDQAVVDDCMARLGVLDLAARQLGALSGGQRQRALVAQGLAQEPDLLLLDEPTTGLDLEARRYVSDVLDDMTACGVTVVHATHDLAAARRADHCLLLDDGRLVAEGSPGQILTSETLGHLWGPTPGNALAP